MRWMKLYSIYVKSTRLATKVGFIGLVGAALGFLIASIADFVFELGWGLGWQSGLGSLGLLIFYVVLYRGIKVICCWIGFDKP